MAEHKLVEDLKHYCRNPKSPKIKEKNPSVYDIDAFCQHHGILDPNIKVVIGMNQELSQKYEKLLKKHTTLLSTSKENGKLLSVCQQELRENTEYYRSVITMLWLTVIILGLNKILWFLS